MKETAMLVEGRSSLQGVLEAARKRHGWKSIEYDPECREIFSPDDIDSRILYLKRKKQWIKKTFGKGGRRK